MVNGTFSPCCGWLHGMSTVGTILETIRERRVRSGYREARFPRDMAPPDLGEPCRRYPTAALLCFLAVVGGAVAAVVLLILLIASVSATRPGGRAALGPGGTPAVKARP